MRNMMRRMLCVLLLAVLCGAMPYAHAESAEASLLQIYGDHMLFSEKEDVNLCGQATPGAFVTCLLEDDAGTVLLKARAQANRSGRFCVTFTAPAGGYRSYRITMLCGDDVFRTLNDVAFGKLWLASGQSNMQFPLIQSDTYWQNQTGSAWLRFLYIAPYATYQGDENAFPYEPQEDLEPGNCFWLTGADPNVANVSAVSFFFAQKLERDLQMPVGVLLPNLGGSLLGTWLSRDMIDSDPVYAAYLRERGLYLTSDAWSKEKIDVYQTITTNYNKKIHPLRSFRIEGMIWYQGESELLFGWERGMYKRSLALLQRSYTSLFCHDGALPLIVTQLAPYDYGDYSLALHNAELTSFQTEDPASRAMTTIYDILPTYAEAAGSIHPSPKQPVGERMAACAEGLVYGAAHPSTAATVANVRIDVADVFVTFRNTGSGIRSAGDRINGFALCGADGVYVQADAEILNETTVRITSPEVPQPVGAAYAFAQNNITANVFSTIENERFMPVAPFCTYRTDGTVDWEFPAFAACDDAEAWFMEGGVHAGLLPVWNADHAVALITKDAAYDGAGGMQIVADKGRRRFSVSPTITYKDGMKSVFYHRMLRDWRQYSAVSVMVRNDGASPVTLQSLRLYTGTIRYFAPDVNGLGEACVTIPPDGQWHKLTFDLDQLYLGGNECGAVYSRSRLQYLQKIELCFTGKRGEEKKISVDEFRFTGAAPSDAKTQFTTELSRADHPLEWFCAIATITIGAIVRLFKK